MNVGCGRLEESARRAGEVPSARKDGEWWFSRLNLTSSRVGQLRTVFPGLRSRFYKLRIGLRLLLIFREPVALSEDQPPPTQIGVGNVFAHFLRNFGQ